MKAASGACRAFAILAAITTLTAPVLSQSHPPPIAPTQLKAELRAALLEARTALIKVVAADGATIDGRLVLKIEGLVDYSRTLHDPDFVRYLQQHLRKEYAAEISHALDPADTREDFAKRIAALNADDDSGERDRVLQLIATQQLDLAMYSDALDTAGRLAKPASRDFLRHRIAIRCYEKGERTIAATAVDAVIQSAVELSAYWNAPELLTRFASDLIDAGDVDDAKRVLLSAQFIASPSGPMNTHLKADLAHLAARIGESAMALELLESVPDEEQRQSIEDALKAAYAGRGNPDGRQVASTIVDDSSRLKAMVAVAQRETAAGDRDNAAASFALARQAAHKDEQYGVLSLVDIAKAQIALGDKASAEETLTEALTENEKPRPGGDQLRGWHYVATVLALMGDFARAHTIAARIDEHAFRADALQNIAYHQTMADELAEAKGWARRLKDPDERGGAFLGIAEAIAEQMKKRER